MFRPGEGFWSGREAALSAEWLEANGLGGYAASTLTGTNTRRYHGLLVAATRPPVGRAVLLSKVEETLVIGNELLSGKVLDVRFSARRNKKS